MIFVPGEIYYIKDEHEALLLCVYNLVDSEGSPYKKCVIPEGTIISFKEFTAMYICEASWGGEEIDTEMFLYDNKVYGIPLVDLFADGLVVRKIT